MTRRRILALAGAAPAWFAAARPPRLAAQASGSRMGIGSSSYGQRLRRDRESKAPDSLSDPLNFLEYCHSLGAGGVQLSLRSLERGQAGRFRRLAEKYGMYVEASVGLPRGDTELSRFRDDVETAKNAGAAVIRSVMLGGRRYETFTTLEAFQKFAVQSWNSLTTAEPVLRRRRMKLAIENHKDWRIDEMLSMIKRISSEYVGICVDTGNNIALLEDPLEVAEAFAPHAYAVHLKDMAVQQYEDGFLLSEVPFGEGFLDLPRIVQVLRQAQPGVRFSLEMITRDPLKIPCLTEGYWATFDRLPGRDLARTLVTVREKQSAKPLPQVSGLSPDERVRVEDENVRKCLAYARDRLAL